MNSSDILLNISDFLCFPTLIQFSKVNKKFNKISKTNFIWKKHFLSLYFGDLSIYGDLPNTLNPLPSFESTEFYKLCQNRGNLKIQWTKIQTDLISEQELVSLMNDLFSSYKEPVLPLPVFRRDSFNFPSIFQDMIGNGLDSETQNPPQAIQRLCENREFIENTLSDSIQLEELNKKRWLLKTGKQESPSRFSVASQSTSAESDKANVVLNIMDLIKKTAKLYCEGFKAFLGQFSDRKDFLQSYAVIWDVYCSSIQNIDLTLRFFCEIVNFVYDSKYPLEIRTPAYSIMRVMAIQWRRTIINTLSDDIISAFLSVVDDYRKTLQNNPKAFFKDQDLLVKVTTSLADISVNELNVFLINHSQFSSDGIYEKLSNEFIKSTFEFYDSLNVSSRELVRILSCDLEMASCIFLPCTVSKIAKRNWEIQTKGLAEKYLQMFGDYIVYDKEIAHQPLVDSAFGKMLFLSNPGSQTKKKIRSFIGYLIENEYISEVQIFNDLDEKIEESKEKKVSDLEIEFKLKQEDLNLNDVGYEENVLFSISNDIYYEDFLIIRANKGINS